VASVATLDEWFVNDSREALRSCEPFRLQNAFLLQDGMTPQRVSTVFLSLHLLTSKDL
jgi:hypothetical protein